MTLMGLHGRCKNVIVTVGVCGESDVGKGLVECFLVSSPSSLGSTAAAVLAQRPVEHL